MQPHNNEKNTSAEDLQPDACPQCSFALGSLVSYCPLCGAAIAQQPAQPTEHAQPPAEADTLQPTPVEKKTTKKSQASTQAAPQSARPSTPQPAPATAPLEPKTPQPPKAAPGGTATPRPPQPPPPPPPSPPHGRGKWILAAVTAVAALGLLYWIAGRSPEIDPCTQTLAQAQVALQNSAWQEAHALGKNAAQLCKDTSRKQEAAALQKSASSAHAKQERARREKEQRNQQAAQARAQAQLQCNTALQNIQKLTRDRRLQSAEQAWARLSASCKEQNAAWHADLQSQRRQLEQLLGETQKSIATRDWNTATSLIEQIDRLNIEQAELAPLRAQVLRGKSAEESSPILAIRPREASTPSAQEGLPAMFRTFLLDAERYMNNHQYDRARAFLESAERLSPNHSETRRMRQRIEKHEATYLAKEIVIE